MDEGTVKILSMLIGAGVTLGVEWLRRNQITTQPRPRRRRTDPPLDEGHDAQPP